MKSDSKRKKPKRLVKKCGCITDWKKFDGDDMWYPIVKVFECKPCKAEEKKKNQEMRKRLSGLYEF